MSFELVLLLVIAAIGFIVQSRLQSVFGKYSKVMFPGGMTGKDIAERMLRDNGITDVKVTHTRGQLTDHYNPATKTVNLSDSVYSSNSVAAAAVAAHECGHAIQHATGYKPLELRSKLVPMVSFSSKYAIIFIIGGIVLIQSSRFQNMEWVFWVGIGMIAISAIFSLVTLPVEYNASKRAMAWLGDERILNSAQLSQANEALTWAARTYVVAAASAVVTLLYYLSFARQN